MESVPKLFSAVAITSAVFVQGASAALLVHFPFDGNATDATGNIGDATLNNGAVTTAVGRFGGALDLTANDGAGIVGASNAVVAGGTHLNTAFANNAMAVSFHQFNNSFKRSSAFWVHSFEAGANDRGFQAHTPWVDGTIYFDHSGCCGGTQRLTATGAVSGQWQHFVFQSDAEGMMEIWIDGELAARAGGSEPLDAFNGIITIGSEGNTDINGFDGLIDDFAIFDRALTQEEIVNYSENPIAGIPEPATGFVSLLGGLLLLRRRR